MKDTAIEHLLRRAPHPAAPADLLPKLQADIPSPHEQPVTRVNGHPKPSFLKRWMPALAFGVFLLSCVVLIGMQANTVSSLKQKNQSLRATTANLAQIRQDHAQMQQRQAQLAELAQLQKDNQDLHQLQAEATRLRTLTGQIRQLRDENQQLASSLSAMTAARANDQFFAEAQQRAGRIACANNLKQIGLAMHIYASDHHDLSPSSLGQFTNELVTPKILICPSDAARQAYASIPWSDFRLEMSSYQLRLSGTNDLDYAQCVVGECPIHHNYLLADGSVQMIDPAHYHEVKKDGRLYLEQIGTQSNAR